MTREIIDPGWAWDDKFSLSQAVKVGNILYISGQIALDPEGNIVGKDDMRAQSERVYENIDALLKKAGGTMENVVKITAFLTDMNRFAEYKEVRGKDFKEGHPDSYTVAITALSSMGLLEYVTSVRTPHT